MSDRSDLEIGDETRVVITSIEDGRDPAGQIEGKMCFVRFPGDTEPEFGESVPVKIADESDTVFVAVADMEKYE